MIARRRTWHGTGQEGFDAKHAALSALGAVTQRFAGELLIAVAVVQRIFIRSCIARTAESRRYAHLYIDNLRGTVSTQSSDATGHTAA